LPNCPKCGAEVNESMSFCPTCGASLKIGQTPAETVPSQPPRRDEKAEKHEKEEKSEKGEKHEKREFGLIGSLVGGLILILLGIMAFLRMTGLLRRGVEWAAFLLVIGTIIIVVAIYGAVAARRRCPET
jgi:uncharacterized Zn finger protein (UPF0148 family)